MACEENLPGQTRDWNEELQVTRELPQSRMTERLFRDRAIFKSNSDFVVAATRAAVSVVNGDIMAINPGETRKQQMFIWNNMFFSLGFDVKEHYKHFGGEHAAYVATVRISVGCSVCVSVCVSCPPHASFRVILYAPAQHLQNGGCVVLARYIDRSVYNITPRAPSSNGLCLLFIYTLSSSDTRAHILTGPTRYKALLMVTVVLLAVVVS